MAPLLDLYIALVSLVFLSILGLISGVAIPGLFLAIAAPLLEKILPTRRKRD